MTTIQKIAISLPGALAGRARKAVRKGRAASVSAYVASALEEKAKFSDPADIRRLDPRALVIRV